MTLERKSMNPTVQMRLSAERAYKLAQEREAEMIARQAQRKAPVIEPEAVNPANTTGPTRQNRTPMNTPRRKLEVAPIAGFRLYWHRSGDIERALEAGYQFVDKKEIRINSRAIGASYDLGGNTALGSEVSIVGSAGTGERLVLMKIPEEYYQDDKRTIFQAHAERMRAIFAGEVMIMPDGADGTPGAVVGADGKLHGYGLSYVRQQQPLFQRQRAAQPQIGGAQVRMY